MKYDAGNMGNHDVETGRAVFDRWIATCDFPVLGANIIDTSTGKPHLAPYKVLERDGVKIVVLGMITPAIPAWLSENLWKGLRFDDMEETARKWMKIIREKENPDLVIGLFHAGQEAFKMSGKYNENASLNVAKNVPGFDIVLMGHDHARECKKVMNVAGDSVLIIDPASNGIVLSNVDVTLKLKDGKVQSKDVKGELSLTKGYHMDPHEVLRSAKFQEEYSQMVIVKDIDFFSLCEHHMLPFYGKAHVAYIPNGYITGLSKIARVVDIFSHRLQVQERMTLQIKECIQETLNPLGVMVVVEAKHMCMQMRGVEKQNSITTTSDFTGAFNQAKTREEFMNLIQHGRV